MAMTPRFDQLDALWASVEKHATDPYLRLRLREALERNRAGSVVPDGYGMATDTAAIRRMDKAYPMDTHKVHVKAAVRALEDAVSNLQRVGVELSKVENQSE